MLPIINKTIIFHLIMNSTSSIRLATLNDIPDLIHLRHLMFEWMGHTDQAILDANDIENKKYFQRAIPDKSFIGWLVYNEKNKAIASGGLVIDHHPPGPSNPSGKIGYIMDISVEPNYRNQGIAKEILKHILMFLKNNNITLVSLHASEMGKSMYEKSGFKPTNEMRLEIAELNKSYIYLD